MLSPAVPHLGSVSPNPKDFSASTPFPAAPAVPLDAGPSSLGSCVCQCLVAHHTFGEKTEFLGLFVFRGRKEPKRSPALWVLLGVSEGPGC